MMPIGPLMIEHRLIERMLKRVEKEIRMMDQRKSADVLFIDAAVDFIRIYADRCHHGKEEDILFRELVKKDLLVEHKKIMDELIQEHKWGRKTVGELVLARNRYAKGDKQALGDIRKELIELTVFYPKHIEKEDKRFFIPIMGYFSDAEKDALLIEGYEFDRKLIHEKYSGLVKALEAD